MTNDDYTPDEGRRAAYEAGRAALARQIAAVPFQSIGVFDFIRKDDIDRLLRPATLGVVECQIGGTGDDYRPDFGDECPLPPDGWWCSRKAGHDGPCAARPVSPEDAR